MNKDTYYMAIDLKSFYASVECIDRGKDPFTHPLVVADSSRGPGAITLAITPALKELGVKNRCRLFEIPSHLSYEIAKPRMKRYMEYSIEVVKTYLEYISFDDLIVYSIDECFLNISPYLSYYQKTPIEIGEMLVKRLYDKLGLTASAGVGTNLFLAKVAMDILAKHQANHIAYLNKERFYKLLSHHRPLTDVWGIGKGIAKRLESYGVYDLADLRRLIELDKKWLYKEWGARAEFLIDHAFGEEPCTIEDIKSYHREEEGISMSQILPRHYTYEEGWIIVEEMIHSLALRLMEDKKVCHGIQLQVRYEKNTYPSLTTSHSMQEGTSLISHLEESFRLLYRKKNRAQRAHTANRDKPLSPRRGKGLFAFPL